MNKGQFKKGHKPTFTKSGKEHPQYRHGQYGTPLYKKWMAMKRRCLNPNEKSYPNYGGRGITICDKWLNFRGFAEDMGAKFITGMSLERIDNDGPYSLENCKWIPMEEQAKNKRGVRIYQYGGKRMDIVDWAKVTGIKKHTLFARLKRYGWTIQDALETPVDLGNKYKRK